jgi:septal ring factor EnvC (AmiA/AmiB activator)
MISFTPFFLFILAFSLGLKQSAPAVAQKGMGVGQDQIEKIETDLSREKEQYLKFHERERDLLQLLTTLEAEIAGKKKSLGELSEKLAQNRADLEKLKRLMNSTEKGLRKIEGRLARRLVAFYKYSKRGTVQVLAASRDLEDFTKRARYLRLIMNADHLLFQETLALQRKHKEEILNVREKLLAIERMEKEENERLLGIREDLNRKVLLLMKIHKEREFYETGVKELELAAKTLREKLVSLDKVEVPRPDLPGGFSAAKGKLPLPCAGKLLKPAASGLESGLKGVFILAAAGNDAKAVFPGRIEFSGNLKGYGEIVVINHGSRYFTVTAYLERRKGEEGKIVKAGEIIGTIGKDDSPSGRRVYFEVRRGGTNLDPAEWLKVH